MLPGEELATGVDVRRGVPSGLLLDQQALKLVQGLGNVDGFVEDDRRGHIGTVEQLIRKAEDRREYRNTVHDAPKRRYEDG